MGDSDFEDMKVDRVQLEADLKSSTTILPLAKVHNTSEQRNSKGEGSGEVRSSLEERLGGESRRSLCLGLGR